MSEQVERRLTFDFSAITKDNLLTVTEFSDYLFAKMKVSGRRNNFTDKVAISTSGESVIIELKNKETGIKKRYLKFLGKKFLLTKELRDWVRVSSDGVDGYTMVYYNVEGQDDKEENE